MMKHCSSLSLLRAAVLSVRRNPIVLVPPVLRAGLLMLFAIVFDIAITRFDVSPFRPNLFGYKGSGDIAVLPFLVLDFVISVGYLYMLREACLGRKVSIKDFCEGIQKNILAFVLTGIMLAVVLLLLLGLPMLLLVLFPQIVRVLVKVTLSVVLVIVLAVWQASMLFEQRSLLVEPLDPVFSFAYRNFKYLVVPGFLCVMISSLQPVFFSYVTNGFKVGKFYLTVFPITYEPVLVVFFTVLHLVLDTVIKMWFFYIYYYLRFELSKNTARAVLSV